MPSIIRLIEKDLSEPYSIFTYRYFVHNWPELCVLALHRETRELVGVAISKAELEPEHTASPGGGGGLPPTPGEADGPHVMRGYIAMLAVETSYRRYGIGSTLVKASIERMRDVAKCAEIVLETEVTNKGALNLYERLGFARDERLLKYYLNGVDAFRLALWFDRAEPEPDGEEAVKES